MELRHSVHTGQHLAISPGLFQSLNILRLSAAELSELVRSELEQNPTLEMPEPAGSTLEVGTSDTPPVSDQDLWRDLESIGGSAAGRRDPLRDDPAAGAQLACSPVSLTDHLTMQLNFLDLDPAGRRCALAVIGSLDDDGYLREPVAGIAATIDEPPAAIEAAVETVQGFDPPGVAARDLEECLSIQLRQMGAGEPAESIVRSYLPLVAREDFKQIALRVKSPLAAVEAAVETIRSLDPSPGSCFDSTPVAAAAVPDVFVNIVNGKINILASREIQPSLKISALYREMAESARSGGHPQGQAGAQPADEETAAYIRQKIGEAAALIRGIEQRRATIVRVASAIAAAQTDFLQYGAELMHPLKLQDVAGELEVHPSTVSRAITGKYMSTPHGIFEFKYFFSSGYQACRGDLAATAVKKRLQAVVSGEDPHRPLSDQKLADLLKRDDIPISRRTVAKYREEMGIAASWDRRKA